MYVASGDAQTDADRSRSHAGARVRRRPLVARLIAPASRWGSDLAWCVACRCRSLIDPALPARALRAQPLVSASSWARLRHRSDGIVHRRRSVRQHTHRRLADEADCPSWPTSCSHRTASARPSAPSAISCFACSSSLSCSSALVCRDGGSARARLRLRSTCAASSPMPRTFSPSRASSAPCVRRPWLARR